MHWVTPRRTVRDWPSAEKLHGDGTPVSVLAPGKGRTKTGRLWVYVRDERPTGSAMPAAVWFQYSPDHRSERPQAHLSDFRGVLQADGYAGFEALYTSGRVSEAACWCMRGASTSICTPARARRKRRRRSNASRSCTRSKRSLAASHRTSDGDGAKSTRCRVSRSSSAGWVAHWR